MSYKNRNSFSAITHALEKTREFEAMSKNEKYDPLFPSKSLNQGTNDKDWGGMLAPNSEPSLSQPSASYKQKTDELQEEVINTINKLLEQMNLFAKKQGRNNASKTNLIKHLEQSKERLQRSAHEQSSADDTPTNVLG